MPNRVEADRESRPTGAHPPVTGIILAAGSSRRMGRPKQLLPWRGKPLLQHVIDAAGAAGLGEIVVVLGHAADFVQSALDLPPGARIVENPDHASGQASSLRVGLEAANPSSEAALVLLGDQPGITPGAMRAVLGEYRRGEARAVRASYGGTPGHPVVLSRAIWSDAVSPGGDVGAGPALARHPEWVTLVPLPGPPPIEVDTPEDFQRLLSGD